MSFAMNPVPVIPATDMKERIEKPHNLTHLPFIRVSSPSSSIYKNLLQNAKRASQEKL